jgi:hypothetical protein
MQKTPARKFRLAMRGRSSKHPRLALSRLMHIPEFYRAEVIRDFMETAARVLA